MPNTYGCFLNFNSTYSLNPSRSGFSHFNFMTNRLLALIAISFLLATTSCVPTKKMIYLQAEEGQNTETLKYDRQEYRLQVNDILDVQIRSMNTEINALFSPGASMNQNMQAGLQGGGDLYYMTGYSVNDDGKIGLPFVGEINVQGQTLEEAKASINGEVSKMFKSFHLQVKLGGIRYSALGEFRSPGKKVILQNQATIFEVIAACGDLTEVANRNEVRLIRQYPDGTKIHTINLLDQSIISSPYYFIQPNDVLYAEPLPLKSWGVGVTGAQTLSTIVSTLSTSLALTLSIISLTR
jgi:polysaccharide export outer membrane protein